MRSLFSFASSFAVVALLAALGGCGPERDLAPTSSGTGTGGAGAGGTGGVTMTSDTGGAATTTTPVEPSGPTKLTIVNGINDHDAIRVCFVPYPSGPDVDPWPSSPSGLAFASAAQVDPPSSLAPGGADVQPHVLAGDLSLIAGMSCSEALALAASSAGGAGGAGGAGAGGAGGAGGGPQVVPPIVASAMPLIPASVLEVEKSLLLVFFGCVGGRVLDGTEGLGCGFTFTPATPTASLTLVGMSRIVDPEKVSLQLVHASAAMQTSDIRIAPGYDNVADVAVVKALALGGLGPKPPFKGLARADYGVLSKVALKTFAPNDIFATSTLLLNDALAKGGLTDAAFQDGSSITLVALGGYPGVAIPSFWHPFTYVALRSDPE